MSTQEIIYSWYNPTKAELEADSRESSLESSRLWSAFMSARLAVAAVMVCLHIALMVTGISKSKTALFVALAYLGVTIATRTFANPKHLSSSFNHTWLALVGTDVAVFAILQAIQGHGMNYTPLFALPILLASILGTLRLALASAAGVTLVLLAGALWSYFFLPSDAPTLLMQSALSGVGYFVIALLANQLASRLASEGQRARQSQFAANIQRQINELVIDSLPDGVLIVDQTGLIRAINPAGRSMVDIRPDDSEPELLDLRSKDAWQPILDVSQRCITAGVSLQEDLTLQGSSGSIRKIRVMTRLVSPEREINARLCVMFLQDLRELEARMRTEKLASMGRMSTAVAHEIRNPLAAISQANALLEEDISDNRLTRLTGMIRQNALRLEKIVDDILNASRVQPVGTPLKSVSILLNDQVTQICTEWATQNACQHRIVTFLNPTEVIARFEIDHLRRILVNLLDNAKRYASQTMGSIQVSTSLVGQDSVGLSVWSDGAPMDPSVEKHLFEPFFSSESRSSGLGLYISRQLCEAHAASMSYQRIVRNKQGTYAEGNEFQIIFLRGSLSEALVTLPDIETPWQSTLY